MNCPNCENAKTEVFLSEPIECFHCHELTYIEYIRCSECSCVFKSIGGEIDEDSVMIIPGNFMSTIGDVMSLVFNASHEIMDEDEFKKMINEVGSEELEVKEIKIGSNNNMVDMIHRCLNCNAIAYESSEGNYGCPDCGFVWEVVTCG